MHKLNLLSEKGGKPVVKGKESESRRRGQRTSQRENGNAVFQLMEGSFSSRPTFSRVKSKESSRFDRERLVSESDGKLKVARVGKRFQQQNAQNKSGQD